MNLTRRQILSVHKAGIIYKNTRDGLTQGQSLGVPMTARSFIIMNDMNLEKPAKSIKDDEIEIIETHCGVFIKGLDLAFFYNTKEEADQIKDQIPVYQEKYSALAKVFQTMLEEHKNDDAKRNAGIKLFERDINELITTTFAQDNSKSNADLYKKAFDEYLDDKAFAESFEFSVSPLKASWFEKCEVLPDSFIEQYINANLLELD